MMDELVFLLLIVLVIFVSIILAWVNTFRLNTANKEIESLKSKLYSLQRSFNDFIRTKEKSVIEKEAIEPSVERIIDPVVTVDPIQKEEPIVAVSAQVPKEPREYVFQNSHLQNESKENNDKQNKQDKKEESKNNTKKKESFERQFGEKLPVWIGGIALALAGVFLVKYSIDQGYLTERVRIILGFIFGFGLLYAGNEVFKKPVLANGTRISQSLFGAGIVTLYAVIYAATNMYGFFADGIGFLGMAAVTASAVLLSLKHGMPIAVMGMVGGFLAPIFVSPRDPTALMMFAYLYLLFTGLMILIRSQKWWGLAIPALVLSFLWTAYWLLMGYHHGDSLVLGVFLTSLVGTLLMVTKGLENDTKWSAKVFFLNRLAVGTVLIFMVSIVDKGNYGILEWGLYGCIAVGSIVMAIYNSKQFAFAPWMSLALNMFIMSVWYSNNATMVAIIIAVFAFIYCSSFFYQYKKGLSPVYWAGLLGASSLGFYLLAYFKLYHTNMFTHVPYFWAVIAITIAIQAIVLVKDVLSYSLEEKVKDKLLAIFSITATSFISLALTIELNKDFLPVAFTLEILAMAYINNRVSIKCLRTIIAVLAVVFTVLLIPQIILLIQVSAYSVFEMRLHLQEVVPFVKWPIFQLGVPAAVFVGASLLLRKQKDSKMVRVFEYMSVSLIGVMGYYLTRHFFHTADKILFVKADFFERGIITNVFFMFSIVCFSVGRMFERKAYSNSALLIFCVALFRLFYFDFFLHNPLWESQTIKGWVVVNSLAITYGATIFWVLKGVKECGLLGKNRWVSLLNKIPLLLLFTWVSFNVRYYFHRSQLDNGVMSNAEIYSYSVAWLLLGIGLLVMGIMKKNKSIRYASLALMILTVGKVFLYDASELEGLLRVFSFLGLGLCLLGLSHFYSRFVFVKEIDSDRS